LVWTGIFTFETRKLIKRMAHTYIVRGETCA
jgi:hypothetical protein